MSTAKPALMELLDLPELTTEEQTLLMNPFPADAVAHLANGEKWVVQAAPPDADYWRNEAVYAGRD